MALHPQFDARYQSCYFEVRIVRLSGACSVGVCREDFPNAGHMVGWRTGSYGLHSDDGWVYGGHPKKNQTLHTEGARHQRRLHLNRKVCVECSEEFYTPEDFRSHQIEVHQRTEQQLLGELDLGSDSQESHASEKMMEHVRRAWQEAASDVDGTSLSSIF